MKPTPGPWDIANRNRIIATTTGQLIAQCETEVDAKLIVELHRHSAELNETIAQQSGKIAVLQKTIEDYKRRDLEREQRRAEKKQ